MCSTQARLPQGSAVPPLKRGAGGRAAGPVGKVGGASSGWLGQRVTGQISRSDREMARGVGWPSNLVVKIPLKNNFQNINFFPGIY